MKAGRVRKIAVTGGSGQLGTLVVRRLLDRPDIDVVVCIDRAPHRIASSKLAFVNTDIRDRDLTTHLSGCDTVVHCAFLVFSNVAADVFRSINVEGSKNVFRAAAAAGVEGVVYLSSISAYGCFPGHPVPIIEETPRIYQPSFPYAACKFEVEAFLDTFERDHPRIAFCRLRPNLLLGRSMPHIVGTLLRKGHVPHHGGAALPIVSDEDVADLVLLAIDKRARGAFNAAADELRTAEELAEQFGLHIVWAPKPLVSCYGALDRLLKKVGWSLPYDVSWAACTAGVTLIASSARAKCELAWSPRYPTASAVLQRFWEITPRRLDRRLALALILLKREGRREKRAGQRARVHLCITGEYGGNIALLATAGAITIRREVPELPTSAIILSSELLCRLLCGKADIESACRDGKVRFKGSSDGRAMLDWMVATFALLRSRRAIAGTGARLVTRALAAKGRTVGVFDAQD
jgi:nucleoside-diphosphate-sugar epimerase